MNLEDWERLLALYGLKGGVSPDIIKDEKAYFAEILDWDEEKLQENLEILIAKGLISYDED